VMRDSRSGKKSGSCGKRQTECSNVSKRKNRLRRSDCRRNGKGPGWEKNFIAKDGRNNTPTAIKTGNKSKGGFGCLGGKKWG